VNPAVSEYGLQGLCGEGGRHRPVEEGNEGKEAQGGENPDEPAPAPVEVDGEEKQQDGPEGKAVGTEDVVPHLKPDEKRLGPRAGRQQEKPVLPEAEEAECDQRAHEEDPQVFQIDPEERPLQVGAGVPAVGVDEHQHDAGEGQQDIELLFSREGAFHDHAFNQDPYQPHLFRRVTWRSFRGSEPSSNSSMSRISNPPARLSTMDRSK